MWARRIWGFVEDDVHKVSTAFIQTHGSVENCPSKYKNKKTVKQTYSVVSFVSNWCSSNSDLRSGSPSPGVSGEEQSLSVGRLAATPAITKGHGCHAHCGQPIRQSLAEVEGKKEEAIYIKNMSILTVTHSLYV